MTDEIPQAGTPHAATSGPHPLFVLSLPRSGSTFMVETLNAHPEIVMTCHGSWVPLLRRMALFASCPAGETVDDGEGFLLPGMVSPEYTGLLEQAVTSAAGAVAGEIVKALHAEEAAYFGDKLQSPLDLDFALARWPSARIVHLVRDFRDTLVSSFAADEKGLGFGWEGIPWQDRIEWAVNWMDQSSAVLGGRDVQVLRYEDLIREPAATIEGVVANLGLEYHPAIDEFLGGAALERFDAHGTSTDPSASIGRWRDQIPSGLIPEVNERFGPLLEEWGYPLE